MDWSGPITSFVSICKEYCSRRSRLAPFFFLPRNRDWRVIHLDGRRKREERGRGGEREREREKQRGKSFRQYRRIPPSHNDVLQERLIFITLPGTVAPLFAGRNPTRCTAHLWSQLFAGKRKKIASFGRIFAGECMMYRCESLFLFRFNRFNDDL